MPGAGELRNRVRFDQRGEDDNGDPLGDWEPGKTVWTQVKWLRGSEAAVSQRLEGKQPVALVIRTSAAARLIGPGFRAVAISGRDVVAGTEFNITAVSPAKEAGFIDILAVAGQAAG
ncbi:MAG: head-tail adaptor protein [Brevundimonas sp.]|nr:MAG: head-tail adaptor protein [Brevundimonas sp.]